MAERVLTTLGVGDLVWVHASDNEKEKVFVKATVLAVDEYMATVRASDNEQRIIQIDFAKEAVMLVNPSTASDMCGLYHIHEPGILENLQERSYNDEPYTLMGSVLVTVNPLKQIKDPDGLLGTTKAATSNIPHPYQIAEISYQQMIFSSSREIKTIGNGNINNIEKTTSSQSIIISGESGAGKTESAKYCLSHLVKRCGTTGGLLDNRLLGTNPILEAFGNATTLRNPNSSRFGKLLKLIFVANDKYGREYKLDGAAVETYLLERSRITYHSVGERNYHVFYMLIYGGNNDFIKSLGLENGPKSFNYLTPIKDGQKISSTSQKDWDITQKQIDYDKKCYNDMDNALEQIGIIGKEKSEIWSILSGILHMGNWIFEDPADSKDGEARITSSTQISVDLSSKLLGVPSGPFVKVFTERLVITPGATIVAKRNARASGYARDAVAKTIYSKLFDWLINKINESLRGNEVPHARNPQIGILDIFGFESFVINGFEQLLINFTNEALQATFNRQVFVAEAQLYEKEGLFGAGDLIGHPQDNSITLDLLQGPGPDQKDDPKTNPKGGLLMLIDAEGMNLDATDVKLNQRLHQTYSKNPAFLKPHPKDIQTTFIVKHYAGPVIYTVGSFLEKNNDSLPGEVDDLMSKSTLGILSQLFQSSSSTSTSSSSVAAGPGTAASSVTTKDGKQVPAAAKGGPPKKPPAKSIVRKFQFQIRELINNLESTRCSFIRCVKPSPTMKRGGKEDREWFDRLYVQRQLISLNISQTAEVLRNGFPTRIQFSVLVDTFKEVLPKDSLLFFKRSGESDHVSFIKALFRAFEIGNDQYKLGLTRVFFRSGQLALLDKVLRAGDEGVSKDIAKRFKEYYTLNIWKRSMAKVRAQNKFISLLQGFRNKVEAAIKIQSVVRGIRPRREFAHWKEGTRMAQRLWRGKKGRRKANFVREEKLRIQREKEEAERLAKLAAIQAAKDAEEKRRLEEEMERLRLEAEEKRRQEEERQRREAEEEARRMAELEAAMKAMEEERKRKEEEERAEMEKKRRQSMMPSAEVRKALLMEALDDLGDDVEDDEEENVIDNLDNEEETRIQDTTPKKNISASASRSSSLKPKEDSKPSESKRSSLIALVKRASFSDSGKKSSVTEGSKRASIAEPQKKTSVVETPKKESIVGDSKRGSLASQSRSSALDSAKKQSVTESRAKSPSSADQTPEQSKLGRSQSQIRKISTKSSTPDVHSVVRKLSQKLANPDNEVQAAIVTKTSDGKVQIAQKGRKIRQKSIAPTEILMEEMKKLKAQQILGKDGEKKKKKKKKKKAPKEGKSEEEKAMTAELQKFRAPVYGFLNMRSMKKSMLFGYRWHRYYFMLSKSDRTLKCYDDSDRVKQVGLYQLAATSKVVNGDDITLKKPYTFQIEDHVIGVMVFSCESKTEKQQWMSDIQQAITGFVSKKDQKTEEEEEEEELDIQRQMYEEQMKSEKLAQLRKLLGQNVISQKEYETSTQKLQSGDSLSSSKKKKGDEEEYQVDVQMVCPKCGTVNNTANRSKCTKCKADLGTKKVPKQEKGGVTLTVRDIGNNSTYLTFAPEAAYQNAQPLKHPLCNTAYYKGVFSCAITGSERGIDFTTFEEFVMYVVECRYKLPDGSIIGWSIARRFKQWRTFAMLLEGSGDEPSPFDEYTKSCLPKFPKKGRWDNIRGVTSTAVVQERDAQLREWLGALMKLAPDASKAEEDKKAVEVEVEEAPEVPEKPVEYGEDMWESVIDPESGEEYWWNKVTGVTTWEKPRADSNPPPRPPKPALLPGWETVVDPVTKEVYYWHPATQRTTWECPVAPAGAKLFDGSQLLHIPAVSKFFELQKYIGEYTKKMQDE